MYIRFQGKRPNPGTNSKLGIFQLAFELRDDPQTPEHAYQTLKENLEWLKMHLKSPTVLDEQSNFRAISWFKDSAEIPLKHIWEIRHTLEDHGYHIDLIKTDDPGNIIYADGWQVVAKPWRSKSKRKR